MQAVKEAIRNKTTEEWKKEFGKKTKKEIVGMLKALSSPDIEADISPSTIMDYVNDDCDCRCRSYEKSSGDKTSVYLKCLIFLS